MTATVTADNGSLIVDRAVDWVSSDLRVATVTPTGKLTATVQGVGPGTVIISAKLDGKIGSMSLIAAPPQPPPLLPQQAFIWSEAEGFVLIPVLPGKTSNLASAINVSGTVVGSAFVAQGEGRPFLWTRTRGPVDLGLLPGFSSCFASGVNDAEEVVGSCSSPTTQRAFRWSAAAGMTELLLPSGAVGTSASGINNDGEIAGTTYHSTPNSVLPRPGRWNRAGAFEALQLPAGTTQGEASAINDAGHVVGWASRDDNYTPVSGVLWKRGGQINIFGLCEQFGCEIFPKSISQNGRVAGSRGGVAFTWTESTGFTNIPRPQGSGSSIATGINDLGQATVNDFFPGEVRASVVSPAGIRRNLGHLPGKTTTRVTAINSSGQAVGFGQ
ncbi:MAG TPA: hypothetical protein VNJ04_12280 [Gemmatimonadaceae bacterium]|nr:hypothetical protein [Gemmatimonadaceae bacterium]